VAADAGASLFARAVDEEAGAAGALAAGTGVSFLAATSGEGDGAGAVAVGTAAWLLTATVDEAGGVVELAF
jgi:hypothetical protein